MPGYLIKNECIHVAGVADLQVRSLLDRQQFADPWGDALRLGISSAAWPLFGLLWPSGQQLAARMALRTVRADERILEIGCGLALASLVSHRRGADVTASDCHPLAAAFLLENLRLNALPPLRYRHGHWTDLALGAAPPPPAGETAVRGRYDLIIGSDLLYERDAQATLCAFIARHAAPGGQVWIVDPNRGNRAAFTRQMHALGYALVEQDLSSAATPDAAAYKGRLMMYRQDSRS